MRKCLFSLRNPTGRKIAAGLLFLQRKLLNATKQPVRSAWLGLASLMADAFLSFGFKDLLMAKYTWSFLKTLCGQLWEPMQQKNSIGINMMVWLITWQRMSWFSPFKIWSPHLVSSSSTSPASEFSRSLTNWLFFLESDIESFEESKACNTGRIEAGSWRIWSQSGWKSGLQDVPAHQKVSFSLYGGWRL